jgi:hypothetical protein
LRFNVSKGRPERIQPLSSWQLKRSSLLLDRHLKKKLAERIADIKNYPTGANIRLTPSMVEKPPLFGFGPTQA